MKNPYTRPTEGVIKLKNGSTTEIKHLYNLQTKVEHPDSSIVLKQARKNVAKAIIILR